MVPSIKIKKERALQNIKVGLDILVRDYFHPDKNNPVPYYIDKINDYYKFIDSFLTFLKDYPQSKLLELNSPRRGDNTDKPTPLIFLEMEDMISQLQAVIGRLHADEGTQYDFKTAQIQLESCISQLVKLYANTLQIYFDAKSKTYGDIKSQLKSEMYEFYLDAFNMTVTNIIESEHVDDLSFKYLHLKSIESKLNNIVHQLCTRFDEMKPEYISEGRLATILFEKMMMKRRRSSNGIGKILAPIRRRKSKEQASANEISIDPELVKLTGKYDKARRSFKQHFLDKLPSSIYQDFIKYHPDLQRCLMSIENSLLQNMHNKDDLQIWLARHNSLIIQLQNLLTDYLKTYTSSIKQSSCTELFKVELATMSQLHENSDNSFEAMFLCFMKLYKAYKNHADGQYIIKQMVNLSDISSQY